MPCFCSLRFFFLHIFVSGVYLTVEMSDCKEVIVIVVVAAAVVVDGNDGNKRLGHVFQQKWVPYRIYEEKINQKQISTYPNASVRLFVHWTSIVSQMYYELVSAR